MAAFVIAVIVGVVVAIIYLTLVIQAFIEVRGRALSGIGDDLGTDEIYDAQGGRFVLKAGLGAVASVVVITLIGLTPSVWYLVPFLAIGTSIAVIEAFLTDRNGNGGGKPAREAGR